MKIGGGGINCSYYTVGRSVGACLCLKLHPQFSNHLNATCYTCSMWNIDVRDILVWSPFHVFESYVYFMKFIIYLYWKSLCLELHPQFSKHNIEICYRYDIWVICSAKAIEQIWYWFYKVYVHFSWYIWHSMHAYLQ